MNDFDKIINSKWEDGMPTVPSNSIDLIITSPPYNVELGNNRFRDKSKGYESYDDNMPYNEYLDWMDKLFFECYRVLKPSGRIAVNIGDGSNGSIMTHVDFSIRMRDKHKFIPITTIVWNKQQIGGATSWGSYQSPSNPSFPTQFEFIIVMAKETRQHIGDKSKITVSGEDFQKNSRALWEFPPETQMMKLYGHPACVDKETEMLTNLGWKKYNEIQGDILAASFNIEKNLIEWNKILDLTIYEHKDKAIYAKGRSIEFITNKSHLFAVKNKKGEFTIKMAKDLKGRDLIPCSAKWNDNDILNNEETSSGIKLNEDFCYLLGFFVADGCFPKCHSNGKYYGAVIDQSVSHNPQKIERIRKILNSLDAEFKYAESDKKYTYKNKTTIKRMAYFYIKGQIRNNIMTVIGCPSKNIPKNILQWKTNLLKSFLDGFVDGDGYHRKFYKTFGVVQKDHNWLDILHAIGVRMGYDSFVKHWNSNSKRQTGYVEFNERRHKVLRNRDAKSIVKEKYYNGIMWCPFIKNNHFFVARRNGRVFITGNCFPEELPRRLIDQLTYEEDVVLDPFSGVGTTCAVAKKMMRHYIGFEMSKKYYETSLQRLSEIPTMKKMEIDGKIVDVPDWLR